jgi:hypothetical protein
MGLPFNLDMLLLPKYRHDVAFKITESLRDSPKG